MHPETAMSLGAATKAALADPFPTRLVLYLHGGRYEASLERRGRHEATSGCGASADEALLRLEEKLVQEREK